MTYNEYISSHFWRTLPTRLAALERDEYRCVGCNTTEDLTVHHRQYPVEWGQERIQDLYVLCISCHEVITSLIRGRRYAKRIIEPEDIQRVGPKREVVNEPRAELAPLEVVRTLQRGVIMVSGEQSNVQSVKIQDYRRCTPTFAQRGTSQPAKSNYESHEEDFWEKK